MAQHGNVGRTPPSAGGDAAGAGRPNISGNRETVESFVFVFLFFLVLSIEAEGFVIPTGSMAPTLMGRQKELECPQCGANYSVNSDSQAVDDGPAASAAARGALGSVCGNCRYPARVGELPSFQGDRIYVMKTPLELPFAPWLGRVELGRWDVAVFKLPEEPDVRYIKRLLGMPDETLRIQRGDIWVLPRGAPGPFRRPDRPLRHQEAMQIPVHDDRHRAKALGPEWARWTPRGPGDWVEGTTATYQTGSVAATMALAPRAVAPAAETGPGGEGWAELVYRHVVPDPAQWAAVAQGLPLPHPPRPTLITDFYSYNTDISPDPRQHPSQYSKVWRQPHWVGDLTLACDLSVVSPAGFFRVELVKAGVVNRVEIDLATGLGTLWHGGDRLKGPTPTGVSKPGTYALAFSNVDDRLCLRVDGRLPFGEGVTFDPGDRLSPTAEDLAPVRLGSKGAGLSVGGLRLSRDIYYTLNPSNPDTDSLSLDDPLPVDPVAMFEWLADPSRFEAFGRLPFREFEIGPGRYMMLGDNSPLSRDGRAWERTDQRPPGADSGGGWDDSGRESWEVPESLLIGKAFCVYWPHLKPFGPAWRFGPNVRLPARPYVEKMRWIR